MYIKSSIYYYSNNDDAVPEITVTEATVIPAANVRSAYVHLIRKQFALQKTF